MNIKNLHIILLVSISILCVKCIDPIDVETLTFEDALVVEATITNENKLQVINLTRTFQFEAEAPLAESNADVSVIDDAQNVYTFQEVSPGKYVSTTPFAAVANNNYELKITTNSGRSYSSNATQLTGETQIDSIVALAEFNANGEAGISIYVHSYNPSGNASYYRYEYEETYKIIAKNWSPYEAVVISATPPYEVDRVLKTKQDKICYNTLSSQGIFQTETNSLTEDRVSDYKLKFIHEDDFTIRERYSILVKQYVQTQEAFAFYHALEELSNSESIFSQNQPGFISGNLFSEENMEEKVIGFFEVASVSEKRIFFNRKDLLTSGSPILDCPFFSPELENIFGASPLVEAILTGALLFFVEDDGRSLEFVVGPGPYVMVPPECGDCTVLGTNIVPDFWIE